MKVFISHSAEDKLLANKIAIGLEDAGLKVFHDQNVLPGENWAERIGHELKESDAMVVVLTPEALRSKYVLRDIEYALGDKSFKGRLIPVAVGSPDQLPEDELPWILKRLQMISLPKHGKQDKGIKQIAQALLAAATA